MSGSRPFPRLSLVKVGLVGLAVLLTAPACGTRVERSASSSGAPSAPAVSGAGPSAFGAAPTETQAAGGSTDTTAVGAAQPGEAATGPDAGTTGRSPNGSHGGAATQPKGSSSASSAPGSGATPSGSGNRSGGSDGSPAPAPKPTPLPPGKPGPNPQPPGQLSPVVVASVGTQSGPAASTTAAITQGGQIWAKYINSKGGLNGHPVNLVVYDDGGDPARHQAQVKEAVEKRGAIAFLSNADAIAGRNSIAYKEQKRIPHIGTMGGITWAYESPMYFPQATDGVPQFYSWLGAMADQLKNSGKKKLGILVCVEAPTCQDAGKVAAREAKGLGYDVTYSGRASIAQPDFTAECLAARNGSSEVFLVIMDSNSLGRVVSACARQGFKPSLVTGASIVVDRFKDDPNLDGLIASTNVFPWFQSNTPATAEYQAAFKQFGGNAVNGVGTATGWASGKLLERAGARMPEPPTNQAVLEGLWSIANDDLGGITNPLTFLRDQKATPVTCWFNLTIKDRKWTTPDAFKRVCVDYTKTT